jgi:hypothetical protein
MWAKLPNETAKAFSAFQLYMSLPVKDINDPSNNRTLLNVSEKLGYKHDAGKPASTINLWSRKYGWVERSNAYDAHRSALVVNVKDASLAQMQQDILLRTSAQLAMLHDIMDMKISQVKKKMSNGVEVEAIELSRMIAAWRSTDDVARRMAHLPTKYHSAEADDELEDEMVFLIGGD